MGGAAIVSVESLRSSDSVITVLVKMRRCFDMRMRRAMLTVNVWTDQASRLALANPR